jgi:hypothetical protein
MTIPDWLHTVAVISLVIAWISALIILIDILKGQRQHNMDHECRVAADRPLCWATGSVSLFQSRTSLHPSGYAESKSPRQTTAGKVLP